MILKQEVKSIVYDELRKHLSDRTRELEVCCDSRYLDKAVDAIHLAVNRFNDSWPMFAETWNRHKENKVSSLSMPRFTMYDFVAKLTYKYINKRMEQTGRGLRVESKTKSSDIISL